MASSAATPINPAQLPSIALHKLPVQLRMLVRVLGEAPAYRLVEQRGGTPYTVPQSLFSPAGQVLAGMVGVAPAAALVADLPGQTLQLPKNDSLLRQLRHQRVLELRGQGIKLAAVALATSYTVRQVINICNRSGQPLAADEEPALQQPDLWPELLADQGPDLPDLPAAHNPFGLSGPTPGANGPEVL